MARLPHVALPPRAARLPFAALLFVILAIALLPPAPAGAHSGVHHPHVFAAHRHAATHKRALSKLAATSPVTIATAVAKRFWGAVPCGGQITVLAYMTLPAGLESTTDGWVTFDSPLGQNDLQAPAGTYTQCTISLAHWQWPTRSAMESDWNMFCLTVIHEMGHLLGHPHSLIPGSVMAAVFTNEVNVPRICRTTRLPGEASVGQPRAR